MGKSRKYFRKWNTIIHRDLGFFFFGVTIIYALSGIALNHIKDWNPSYIVDSYSTQVPLAEQYKKADRHRIQDLLQSVGETAKYKKHIAHGSNGIKIFIQNGSAVLDFKTQILKVEKIRRRPIFFQINSLHYNPGKWWKWFSDIFAISLIILAVSGVMITGGKKGIKGRGGILIILGFIVPVLFLVLTR